MTCETKKACPVLVSCGDWHWGAVRTARRSVRVTWGEIERLTRHLTLWTVRTVHRIQYRPELGRVMNRIILI